MSQLIEIKVPDIGDYSDIPVIELCVQVGDTVKLDDALVTLESDKATMWHAGTCSTRPRSQDYRTSRNV